MRPLDVALLWHMHQPSYRNPSTDVYELPWVRLRAAKDYVHMLAVLADYPNVHVTINWTPVLLAQLDDYAQGRARDRWLELACRQKRSAAEKRFMLQHFFSINWERFVQRYPGYERLLTLRQVAGDDPTYLSDTYWQDLAVWFNLAWFDPGALQRDPALRALAEKGSGFSAADLEVVLERQMRAAAAVLPLCRELAGRGQVELSTSPYHHPILPLLIDSAAAREASPDLPLPAAPTGWVEDARAHIAAAIRAHERYFGAPPRGIWPSEGALSQATVELLAEGFGLAWVAADEGLLARALNWRFERDSEGNLLRPDPLYQPYTVAGGRLAIFFRDQILSDRIGFAYAHVETKAAVDDFIGRLLLAQRRVGDEVAAPVASIILDGENCWEHYPNNGDDFLRLLYQRLSAEPNLRTTTFSGYLAEHQPTRALARLPAGSWIGANLETWIGEPAQNRAWDELARARARLRAAGVAPRRPDVASGPWAALWAAEASDWFWWYCSRNQVGPEVLFDALFREHLRVIYTGLRIEPPPWLGEPLTDLAARERIRAPTGLVRPNLRAEAHAGAEWAAGGWVAPEASTGTMQRGTALLRRLRYGWSASGLALRLEAGVDLAQYEVIVQLGQPGDGRTALPLDVPPLADTATFALLVWHGPEVRTLRLSADRWLECGGQLAWALRDGVLECLIPIEMAQPLQGEHIELRVALRQGPHVLATLPTTGTVALAIPPPKEEGKAC